jgi:hypothetical protein
LAPAFSCKYSVALQTMLLFPRQSYELRGDKAWRQDDQRKSRWLETTAPLFDMEKAVYHDRNNISFATHA